MYSVSGGLLWRCRHFDLVQKMRGRVLLENAIGAKTDWPCFACMTRPVFKGSSSNPDPGPEKSLLRKTGPTSWGYRDDGFVPPIERSPRMIDGEKPFRYEDESWSDSAETQPDETAAGCRYCPLPHGEQVAEQIARSSPKKNLKDRTTMKWAFVDASCVLWVGIRTSP